MSTSGTAPSLPPSRPVMVVVAGPAGSGKTTVFPLVAVFDRVECFDNTAVGRRPVRVLAFEQGHVVGRFAPLPRWATALTGGREPR